MGEGRGHGPHLRIMTLSNQTLWLGAIYEMTLAGLSSVRFVTWQTAVALRLGGSGQLWRAFFRRIE